MAFCPVETIITRGLKVFIDYQEHKAISEYLKANKAEEGIKDYKKELDMTDNELIFAIIDAYRHEILGMSVKERLKLNGDEVGDKVYVFQNLPIEGKSVYLGVKEKSINDYLSELAEENEIKNENKVRDYISEAERQLKSLEKENNLLETQYNEIVAKRRKLEGEVKLLKATEIFKLDYKARADHKKKIAAKEKEAVEVMQPIEDIKEEMKKIRNKKFYVNEDIEQMKGLFETSPIQVDKLKDKYNPDTTKYPKVEETW